MFFLSVCMMCNIFPMLESASVQLKLPITKKIDIIWCRYLRQAINVIKHFVFSSNFSFSFRFIHFWWFCFLLGNNLDMLLWGGYMFLCIQFWICWCTRFYILELSEWWSDYFLVAFSKMLTSTNISQRRSNAILKNMTKYWQLHIFDKLNIILLLICYGWI